MKSGTLSLLSLDGSTMYGELTGATWSTESTADGGNVHLLNGIATEGTYEEIRRVNDAGVDRLRFRFEADGSAWTGEGRLLASEHADAPASAIIHLESFTEPSLDE